MVSVRRRQWRMLFLVGIPSAILLVAVCSYMSRLAPLDLVRWGPLVVGSGKMADIEIVLTQSPTFDGYITKLWVRSASLPQTVFWLDQDASKWAEVKFVETAGDIHVMRREIWMEYVLVAIYDPRENLVYNYVQPEGMLRRLDGKRAIIETIPFRLAGNTADKWPG